MKVRTTFLVLVGLTALLLPATRVSAHGAGAHLVSWVASVEGVTPSTLKADLKAGETLLQIAGNKYASAGDLATALLQPVQTKLQSLAALGAISAAQETSLYDRLHSRVARLVVTPHPALEALSGGVHVPAAASAGPPGAGVMQAFLTTCNTTHAALLAAVRAGGQTPLAICQTTNPGITASQLVAALMVPVKAWLDAAATKSAKVAAAEPKLLAAVEQRLTTWVTTPIRPLP